MTPRAAPCEVCQERSSWDFLRDFYSRVDFANEYARRLEIDLHQTTHEARRSQLALTQCEASLVASWEMLNEERLEHRASQEALTFERERHQETIELLERIFKEAVRSGEIADSLGNQVAALQAASSLEIKEVVPQTAALLEASPSNESLMVLEAPTSANQGSDSAKQLPEAFAGNSPGPTHLDEEERHQAAQPANVNHSGEPEHKCHFRLLTVPLQSTETESSTSDVTGPASSGEGASSHKRSKRSSVTRKRSRLPPIIEDCRFN